MANYRPILVQIWKDPHFQDFTISEKLIFICLFTNESVTESGVYRLTFKTIRNLTDVPMPSVKEAILNTFKKRIVYDQENSIIWVKNFLRYNGHGKPNLIIRSILNDYEASKKSNVWDGYWEYNCGCIEKLINKSAGLQRDIIDRLIVFPKETVSYLPIVNKLLGNSKLSVV